MEDGVDGRHLHRERSHVWTCPLRGAGREPIPGFARFWPYRASILTPLALPKAGALSLLFDYKEQDSRSSGSHRGAQFPLCQF